MNSYQGLAQQQRDFLQAIFASKNIATQAINTSGEAINKPLNSYAMRGLQTYQANAGASARRSLQAAYPVISQLIGDEAFACLARDFWEQHPPTCGDLAQWGDKLTGFIACISALENEPYLSDVAKAEWALHKAATVADLGADFASFSLLTDQDPSRISLLLAPGTTLIQSKFPIASILTAHLYAAPSLEEVGEKLRQDTPEIALVSRNGLRPIVSSCMLGDARFINQLLAGQSLLTALESSERGDIAGDLKDFDFHSWLPKAVQTGLLLGAYVI
jgi:hypothetical protein